MRSRDILPTRTPFLVRWNFEKGRAAVACRVSREPDGFAVVTEELRPGHDAAVERFEQAGPALIRHAFIASALRDAGWQVTHRSR